MKQVLVIGEPQRVAEFKRLNLQNAEVTFIEHTPLAALQSAMEGGGYEEDDEDLIDYRDMDDDEENGAYFVNGSKGDDLDTSEYDIVFDLNFDEESTAALPYLFNQGQVVIGCAVKRSLAELVGPYGEQFCKFIGMNAFPTFIDRAKLEMSLLDPKDLMVLEATMKTLGLEYELVHDEVGMVAPRVISMIINEAAFLVGEGTASIEGTDQAMKLGTNYPMGPFEWCDAIGVDHVVELLESLGDSYLDGRYKLAPLLRRHRDMNQPFYPSHT